MDWRAKTDPEWSDLPMDNNDNQTVRIGGKVGGCHRAYLLVATIASVVIWRQWLSRRKPYVAERG